MSLHNKWWSKCVSFTWQIWKLLIVEELLWSECRWRSDSMMEVWRWRRVWRILKAGSQSQSRRVKHFQLFCERPLPICNQSHWATSWCISGVIWLLEHQSKLGHSHCVSNTFNSLVVLLGNISGVIWLLETTQWPGLSHDTVTACQTLSTLIVLQYWVTLLGSYGYFETPNEH